VGDVDQGVFEQVAVERFAAGASHQRTWFLRWHLLAAFPHRIFVLGPVALIAPRPKIGFGAVRQEHLPCRLEIGAGLVERRGGAVGAFAGMTAGIEAARPTLRILVPGNAGADRDRADMHIAVIDVPAFLVDFGIAAAREFGHALLKRAATFKQIIPYVGPGSETLPIGDVDKSALIRPEAEQGTVRPLGVELDQYLKELAPIVIDFPFPERPGPTSVGLWRELGNHHDRQCSRVSSSNECYRRLNRRAGSTRPTEVMANLGSTARRWLRRQSLFRCEAAINPAHNA
jgi:hypothetical protein